MQKVRRSFLRIVTMHFNFDFFGFEPPEHPENVENKSRLSRRKLVPAKWHKTRGSLRPKYDNLFLYLSYQNKLHLVE